MKRFFSTKALTMVFLTIFACTPKMDKNAVVSVDGEVFSENEFFAEVDKGKFTGLDSSQQRKVVKRFALQRIVAMEAERLGLLNEEGVEKEETALKDRLIVDKILEEEVWAPLLTDSSLKILYDRLGKEVNVHHIVLTFKRSQYSSADRSEKTALNLIGEIREKIIKGEMKFFEAAKQYSEDPSRLSDGVLGLFRWGKLFEPLQSIAFSLKAGEISEPVRSDVGYHIIRVSAVKKIPQPPYEQIVPQLKKFMRGGRGHEFELELSKFESRLQRRYAVRFNSEVTKQLFSELRRVHENKKAPRAEEITKIDIQGVVCVAGGVPVGLPWFKERITLLGPPLSQSLITSEKGLIMTLEHVLYRFLAQKFAEETRDEAWNLEIEEQFKRRQSEIPQRILINYLSEINPDASIQELMKSLMDKYTIQINEEFLVSYGTSLKST